MKSHSNFRALAAIQPVDDGLRSVLRDPAFNLKPAQPRSQTAETSIPLSGVLPQVLNPIRNLAGKNARVVTARDGFNPSWTALCFV